MLRVLRVDVDEHRPRAGAHDHVGGGDPGQRRGDDLVAGADAGERQADFHARRWRSSCTRTGRPPQ